MEWIAMTRSTEPAAANNSVLSHPYIVALNKPLGRRRASAGYIVLATIVAGLMILLPLIYLGLIVLLGYLLYWYFTLDVDFDPRTAGQWIGAVLFYIAPVAGVITFIFMLKPLFVRRRIAYRRRPISPSDEPLLVAYVERLCEVVGAPKPAEIEVDMNVNASAGFASNIFSGKMALMIGLPLAAGMTLQEFTGVLSHELGHFAQRGGMRLNYVIRKMNLWFARAVYERDAFDQLLYDCCRQNSSMLLAIVAYMGRGGIWISKRVLWVLMMIGHLFSMMLLRAQEFDADACAARVIGSAGRCEELRKLPVLEMAIRQTYSDLSSAFEERRLPEDISQLLVNRMQESTPAEREELRRQADRERSGWFSTHPSQLERTTAAMALREPGVIALPAAPAASLFADFDGLSKAMTRQYYQEALGGQLKGIELVPVAAIEKKRETLKKQSESLTSFFGDLLDVGRPLFFSQEQMAKDEQGKLDELLAVRKELAAKMPAAAKAVAAWERDSIELLKWEVLTGLRASGILIKVDGIELTRGQRTKLAASTEQSRSPIDAALKLALRRVQLALALSPPPKKEMKESDELDFADDPNDPMSKVMEAMAAMHQAENAIGELRVLTVQQRMLFSVLSSNRDNQALVETIVSRANRQIAAMERMRQIFRGVAYPFSESRGMTIESFVMGHPALATDLFGVIKSAEYTLTQSQFLYHRAMAALAEKCETIEEEMGLSKMPFPATGKVNTES
jgi:Zn-dependent protease with chaperone function